MNSIKQYLEVLKAEQYALQVCHCSGDNESYKPIRWNISSSQLIKKVTFLKHLNTKGYNIYARPLNHNFILVDDIMPEWWSTLLEHKPCWIMETSPKNYQAFFRIPDKALTKEEALQYCVELAKLLQGDLKAAKPTQPARLPGFTNRKPKHLKRYGFYPWVSVKYAVDQSSCFSPQGGQLASPREKIDILRNSGSASKAGDRSRYDYWICCACFRKGMDTNEVARELELKSEKVQELRGKRRTNYIQITVKRAQEAVQNSFFKRRH